jgi:hypothetical protein
MAATAAIGKIAVVNGMRGSEVLPLMDGPSETRVAKRTVFDRKPFELPKASCGLKGARGVPPLRPLAPDRSNSPAT